MNALIIEPTNESPMVCLDLEKNIFEISGKSVLSEVDEFYDKILNWLDNAAKEEIKYINFVFNLDYFNIASSKRILFILYKLNDMHKSGKKIIVSWCYKHEDDDMKEVGEDFAFMVNIPFNFVGYAANEKPFTDIPKTLDV